MRGTRWFWYGLARASDLRAPRCDLVATDVFDGDDLLPLSDRHVDAIACPYPSGTADYATLTKAERSVLRGSFGDRYTACCELLTLVAQPATSPNRYHDWYGRYASGCC